MGFERLRFWGKRPFVNNGRFVCKAYWGGESEIALWVFERFGFWGKRPFVNNGRFAYAKLAGAGNLRLPCGFLRDWVFGGNGRL